MKPTSLILTAILIAGHADPAFAKLDRVVKKLMPCGGGDLCAVDDPGFDSPAFSFPETGGSTTTTCETTSWGNATEGGTETVCMSSDGSSTWESAEWADGVRYEDSGSVTILGPAKFRATSSSSDSSSSSYSGYAK